MTRQLKHSFEFKLRCVLEVVEEFKSENSVSKRYKINHKLVNDWVRIYRYSGI